MARENSYEFDTQEERDRTYDRLMAGVTKPPYEITKYSKTTLNGTIYGLKITLDEFLDRKAGS